MKRSNLAVLQANVLSINYSGRSFESFEFRLVGTCLVVPVACGQELVYAVHDVRQAHFNIVRNAQNVLVMIHSR